MLCRRPVTLFYAVDPEDDTVRQVAESPYIVRIASGKPTARSSTVVGTGRRVAVEGQCGGFIVEPRDVYGNRVDARHLPDGLPLQVHTGRSVVVQEG